MALGKACFRLFSIQLNRELSRMGSLTLVWRRKTELFTPLKIDLASHPVKRRDLVSIYLSIYIYIYIIKEADSSDFLDSFSPSVPIDNRSCQVVYTVSRVHTKQMNVSLCCSANTLLSMCPSQLNECPGYDTKPSDGEAPTLEL